MKKLIITALAALTIGTTSYAITADEAIASKNWYTINEYCKSNKLQWPAFLFKSNTCNIAYVKDLYSSVTNTPSWIKATIPSYSSAYFTLEETLQIYKYEDGTESSWISYVNQFIPTFTSKTAVNRTAFLKYVFEKDIALKNKNLVNVAETAIKIDAKIGGNKYRNLVYNRCKTNASAFLALAISFNDVDSIIDALMLMDDSITAAQVAAIIEPLNALDVDYRKDDVVKVLRNINSWCTIKLYDDQATWEPLLAKIRAMISVRK